MTQDLVIIEVGKKYPHLAEKMKVPVENSVFLLGLDQRPSIVLIFPNVTEEEIKAVETGKCFFALYPSLYCIVFAVWFEDEDGRAVVDAVIFIDPHDHSLDDPDGRYYGVSIVLCDENLIVRAIRFITMTPYMSKKFYSMITTYEMTREKNGMAYLMDVQTTSARLQSAADVRRVAAVVEQGGISV